MLARPTLATKVTACVATAEQAVEAAYRALQATRLTSPSQVGSARQRLRAAVLEATRSGAPLRARGTK